ncbi:hypothetical protein IT403_00565 [Candidatus Nomurabacteria bacterium]|nr:hypothetical protein [Candidatus Nomurabacteria bacterium]
MTSGLSREELSENVVSIQVRKFPSRYRVSFSSADQSICMFSLTSSTLSSGEIEFVSVNIGMPESGQLLAPRKDIEESSKKTHEQITSIVLSFKDEKGVKYNALFYLFPFCGRDSDLYGSGEYILKITKAVIQ